MVLAWACPVYALALLMAPAQGWLVLRSWRWHLMFLIPAVVIGGFGAITLMNSSPVSSFRGGVRGACSGLAAGIVGSTASCLALTTNGAEGKAWFGVLQIPIVLFAVVTGFGIGMIHSPDTDDSDSA